MRVLNIIVIAALILAAAFVYKIKFETTLEAEGLAKLRGEIRRERDAIAFLRAEWARLDNPTRIQGLAQRHLLLQPLNATQFGNLDQLPERPQHVPAPRSQDPIGAMIGNGEITTGTVKPAGRR